MSAAAPSAGAAQQNYLGGEPFTLMSKPTVTPRASGAMSWPSSPSGATGSPGGGGEDDLQAVRAECAMLRKQLGILASDDVGHPSAEEGEAAKPDTDRSRRQTFGVHDSGESFEAFTAKMESEEEVLRREIEEVNGELAGIQSQRAVLDAQVATLGQEEEQYWHSYNSYRMQREHLEGERDFALSYCKRLDAHEEELKQKNVCNDSFYIWHDGPFGTINGFRLGRLPNHPIEWSEINAAWGQVVLLLDIMAKYKGYSFLHHRLIPMGSFSRIVEGSNIMELYGSASWFSSFDRAMIAFLQCVREFGEFAEKTDPTLKLPYHIEGDKIGVQGKADKWFQIKRRFNHEEKWTKALKYMLTNLKWLVAWHCRHDRAKQASMVGQGQGM